MNCNCHTCPYQKQIDALRRRCLRCNPETDAGTPHHRVRADEFTLSRPRPLDFSATPSGQATNLSADDEHRLRMAMSAFFGLDLIDLAEVSGLMRGLSYEQIAAELKNAARTVMSYHGRASARLSARKAKILAEIPVLSPVLKNTTENDSAARITEELTR